MPLSEKDLAAWLAQRNVPHELLEHHGDTPTAQSAAAAFGVPVSRIVKSLLFADRASGRFVLVVAAGDTRVDTSKLGVGRWTLARADEVERVTGFPVGTVPPVGHATPVRVVLDARVAALDGDVIGGGGGARASVRIAAREIERLTGAYVRDVG